MSPANQFETAWSDLHTRIVQYARQNSRDRRDADEAVQDVFLRFYLAIAAGDVIRDPKGWLFCATKRQLIDQGKYRRRRSNQVELTAEAETFAISQDASQEHAFLEQERQQVLQQAMQALTPLQRRCVELRAQGLRQAEIGARVGSTNKLVCEAIQRGTKTLRQQIERAA